MGLGSFLIGIFANRRKNSYGSVIADFRLQILRRLIKSLPISALLQALLGQFIILIGRAHAAAEHSHNPEYHHAIFKQPHLSTS